MIDNKCFNVEFEVVINIFSRCQDQFENGSNMIVSIIYRMILDFIKDHKSLPPVLFLNVDNCGRENKVICNIKFQGGKIVVPSE